MGEWEKETQIDRLRERIPFAQLLTNTKTAMQDPMSPKLTDWIGSAKRAGAYGKFVIIPVSLSGVCMPIVLEPHLVKISDPSLYGHACTGV